MGGAHVPPLIFTWITWILRCFTACSLWLFNHQTVLLKEHVVHSVFNSVWDDFQADTSSAPLLARLISNEERSEMTMLILMMILFFSFNGFVHLVWLMLFWCFLMHSETLPARWLAVLVQQKATVKLRCQWRMILRHAATRRSTICIEFLQWFAMAKWFKWYFWFRFAISKASIDIFRRSAPWLQLPRKLSDGSSMGCQKHLEQHPGHNKKPGCGAGPLMFGGRKSGKNVVH